MLGDKGDVRKLRNARFSPPNGGPKEKLRWINDGEADLLRSIGGSGKEGKFGLQSFYTDEVSGREVSGGGGNTGSGYTFRSYKSNPNISGNWNTGGAVTGRGSIDRGITPVGRRQAQVSRAPVAVQPVTPRVVAPAVVPPEIYLDPQIAGRLQAAQLSPTKAFPARPSVIAPNSFNTPAQPSSFPARPSVTAPNSFNTSARPFGAAGGGSGGGGGGGWGGDDASYSEPASTVPAGQKVTDVFGPSYPRDPSINGRLTDAVPAGQKVTDVFGPDYAKDPQIAGRLEATRQPGYGVSDLPDNTTDVAKTPGPRINLGESPLANRMAISGGNVLGIAGIPGPVNTPTKMGDRLTPETADAQDYPAERVNDSAPNYKTTWDWQGLGQMDKNSQTVTPREKPSIFGGGPGTFGPETPAGDEDWQRGPDVNPASYETPLGGALSGLAGRVPRPRANPRRSASVFTRR